jgi:BirA family transcriptional regulator, biotin operon repressor / biotin---[acetyl-CoA-carboxylase] ligase
MHLPDPKLPPLFTGHPVSAPMRPLAEACRGAQVGRYGAGDLIWARTADQMSLALVLEPDVPLATACQMNALAHVAVAETLGHLCPPQMAIEARWPGVILINGAVCGAITLAVPTLVASAVPAWLAIGIELVIDADRLHEPGERPNATSLIEEGGAVTRTDLIEALATRLLAWLDTWQTDGFRPIHDQWLFRAEGREADVVVDGIRGRVLGLDDAGNLLLKPSDGRAVGAAPMLPHVQVPV